MGRMGDKARATSEARGARGYYDGAKQNIEETDNITPEELRSLLRSDSGSYDYVIDVCQEKGLTGEWLKVSNDAWDMKNNYERGSEQ